MDTQLTETIQALEPWHIEIEVTPGITTSNTAEHPGVSFIKPQPWFQAEVTKLFPGGLQGKRFLDCACNCGAYCFWAKDLGAIECFGFDVRQHWITRAEFLLEHKPTDSIHFEVLDLISLPERGLKPFDLTLFSGIFYHLPDPIAGLKYAADLTQDAIIVNTAWVEGSPNSLVAKQESTTHVMSGVHGLCWYPTDEHAIYAILRQYGFSQFNLLFKKHDPRRLAIAARRA